MQVTQPSCTARPSANQTQCSQSDLICVALVSKHFHELASSFLYRNFHIIFPDDDDINFDSPIDGLAGGLDTFTTSEYNYAKHLKDVSMDTLSSGVKGEHSYQSYLYSASCGKFLNTLLYLTLRKATALEAFRFVPPPFLLSPYIPNARTDGTYGLSSAGRCIENCTGSSR